MNEMLQTLGENAREAEVFFATLALRRRIKS